MGMQVILDSLFARPGSAPVWSGKKGEFTDWIRREKERADFLFSLPDPSRRSLAFSIVPMPLTESLEQAKFLNESCSISHTFDVQKAQTAG